MAVNDIVPSTHSLALDPRALDRLRTDAAATPEKARRVLKRRMKALGDLRDTHVQRLFIQCRMARFPELILVEDVLRRRERRLQNSDPSHSQAYQRSSAHPGPLRTGSCSTP